MAFAIKAYTDDGHRIERTLPYETEAEVDAYAQRERLHLVGPPTLVGNTTRRHTKIQFIAEKADLYRELALYIADGVPKKEITKDLIDLADPESKWHKCLLSFLTAYEKKTIAQAMDEQSDVFEAFERNLLRRVTGQDVVPVLQHLSTYFERLKDTRGRITNALIVPGLQVLGVFGLILLYMFQVVPSMRDLAAANNGPTDDPMPQSFVILGNIHDWVLSPNVWPFLIAGVLAFIGIVGLLSRNERVQRLYDKLLLNNRITYAYLLERRLMTLFSMGLIIQAGHQRDALLVARDSAIGAVFYEELNTAHRVNIGLQSTADGRKRVKWYEALASAPTVFDRRTRTILKNADKRGVLPQRIVALIETLTSDLKRELQQMPQMLNLAATAIVFFSLLMLLMLFILPFSTYIAHFGA